MSEVQSDPQMMIMGGRDKGGRPRVADPLVPVLTRLPSEQYDRLIKMALRRGESVSSLVRAIVMAQSFLK